MVNETNSLQASSSPISKYWQGLGLWNLYFLLKFALLWFGYLNFHPLENVIFLAFLLMPLPAGIWRTIRFWIALPIGFVLLWYDTWLPGFDSIRAQGSQLLGFDIFYLMDLVNRFINWKMVGVGFAIIVGYLFIAQWIRVTLFVVVTLIWLNIVNLGGPAVSLLPRTVSTTPTTTNTTGGTTATASTEIATDLPPTTQNLNTYLTQFYANQKDKMTAFPASLPTDAQPFDILVVNICSLSWSDINSVDLANHPLWQHFDIIFDNFNSATSYSGPASIRLLRASCGQTSHKDLYSPAPQQCYLFENLARLGFANELMLDHPGIYGNYLDELRQYGGITVPLKSQAGLRTELTSFDGDHVYDDAQILSNWLQERGTDTTERSATFFNIIPLHDGDRFVGQTKTAPYQARAKALFDKLDQFITDAEQSGRRVLLMVVPEHGAALVGDKIQISGLRDIPSPSITHVPVGIKFINMKAAKPTSQIHVQEPTSYLAVSEMTARLVDGKVFTEDNVDWQALVQNLPQTPVVSENDNAIVMGYQNQYYVSLSGGSWVPYPQR